MDAPGSPHAAAGWHERPPPVVSLAPMMDRTDRWFRRVFREVSRHCLLYTEMLVADAILRGKRERMLAKAECEHPIALQLGGDDPQNLAAAARIAVDHGYDEINLNVGCPSDRVRDGAFGACLMLRPERVAECVAAMRAAVPVPVTVKHRIGVDDRDRYEDLLAFVDIVAAAGCDRFTVHARKAWLSGLSPKQNRTVPPLRYPEVHQLARERPKLFIEINGGIGSLAEIDDQLMARGAEPGVRAVMIGRAPYDDPFAFVGLDALLARHRLGPPPATAPAQPRARRDVIEALADPFAAAIADGERAHPVLRHLLNLWCGGPGNKAWRRGLSALSQDPTAVAHRLRALAADCDALRAQRPSVLVSAAAG